MYEAREQLDILKELQGYSQVEASKIEGTFEYDVLASNSIEFAKSEVELEQIYKASFADTSWGEYLTMITEQYGVLRKAATNAIGADHQGEQGQGDTCRFPFLYDGWFKVCYR